MHSPDFLALRGRAEVTVGDRDKSFLSTRKSVNRFFRWSAEGLISKRNVIIWTTPKVGFGQMVRVRGGGEPNSSLYGVGGFRTLRHPRSSRETSAPQANSAALGFVG